MACGIRKRHQDPGTKTSDAQDRRVYKIDKVAGTDDDHVLLKRDTVQLTQKSFDHLDGRTLSNTLLWRTWSHALPSSTADDRISNGVGALPTLGPALGSVVNHSPFPPA